MILLASIFAHRRRSVKAGGLSHTTYKALVALALLWQPIFVACYNANDVVAVCERQHGFDYALANECAVRNLARMSEQQMSVSQYLYITDRISGGYCNAACNVLVFGVGGDSPIWISANRHGRTVFIEQNMQWATLARERSPQIEVYVVDYHTRMGALSSEMVDLNRKFYEFLPSHLISVTWTVLLIDAPTAFAHHHPGRLQPVWFSARHVASRGVDADVFLHDYNRRAERTLGRYFFSFPYQSHPLLISSPHRYQVLAHWNLRKEHKCIARQLASAPAKYGFKVLSVVVRSQNRTEAQCDDELRGLAVESLLQRDMPPQDCVALNIESDEDGILQLPTGSASVLKTHAVLSALLLGHEVLYVDSDTLFTRQFNPSTMRTMSTAARRGSQRFIIQSDMDARCVFRVNPGFFLAQPSTLSARTLLHILELTASTGISEQTAWTRHFQKLYQPLCDRLCHTSQFVIDDKSLLLRLLPSDDSAIGVWRTMLHSAVPYNNTLEANHSCDKLQEARKFQNPKE